MSEQQAEPISGETGAISAETAAPIVPKAKDEPEAAVMASSPDLVPEQAELPEVVMAEMPEPEVVKAEAPKSEAPKAEAPEVEASEVDAPRSAGTIMVMTPDDRVWEQDDTGPESKSEQPAGMFGKRRMSALAAVAVMAAVAGAMGGSLATVGLGHFMGNDGNHAIEASVARIDADIQALKAGVEHTSKVGTSQFSKTNDRLDKIEKAQAEPAARLAKLSETVDKLRATPAAPVAAAPAPAAPKEVTGSVTPPPASPKPEVSRLPTVEGWVLRNVVHGGALIEGRQGIFEVYAGDPVPGLGRIDAIRRQDGRWVVVTSKGLIVAR